MDFSGIMTTTAQSLMGYVADGLHQGGALPARFMTRTIDWDQGQYYQQPIQTQESTQGGPFVGMPVLNVSAENTDKNLQWTARGDSQPIVVPWVEVAYNKTKAGVINLTARKIEVSRNALLERLAKNLYKIGNGALPNGLQESTDDGTLTASYGNLDRPTYGSVINGKVTPINGNVALSNFSTQFDLCTPANTAEGTTLVITTKTIFSYAEALLDSRLRETYMNIPSYVSAYTPNGGTAKSAELGGASGFLAIFHRAVPIIKDEQCDTGSAYTLNEDAFDYVNLQMDQTQTMQTSDATTKGVYADQPSTTALQMTKMMNPYNQFGDIGHILVYGDPINRKPNRSGVMTGITGHA